MRLKVVDDIFQMDKEKAAPRVDAHGMQVEVLGIDVEERRAHEVGGSQVPLAVFSLATAYLMAGNLSAYGYVGLTQGAAHLLEVFGDEALRTAYMAPMYRGEWTGTDEYIYRLWKAN